MLAGGEGFLGGDADLIFWGGCSGKAAGQAGCGHGCGGAGQQSATIEIHILILQSVIGIAAARERRALIAGAGSGTFLSSRLSFRFVMEAPLARGASTLCHVRPG